MTSLRALDSKPFSPAFPSACGLCAWDCLCPLLNVAVALSPPHVLLAAQVPQMC